MTDEQRWEHEHLELLQEAKDAFFDKNRSFILNEKDYYTYIFEKMSDESITYVINDYELQPDAWHLNYVVACKKEFDKRFLKFVGEELSSG